MKEGEQSLSGIYIYCHTPSDTPFSKPKRQHEANNHRSSPNDTLKLKEQATNSKIRRTTLGFQLRVTQYNPQYTKTEVWQ